MNFKNQTIGCGDIAYSPVEYFILSHPVYCEAAVEYSAVTVPLQQSDG